MEVIFDDREHDLWQWAQHIDVAAKKRLEVFDIMVFVGGVIIAAIERKTWKDLAISLKDGRLISQGFAQQQLWQGREYKFLRVLLVEGTRGIEHAGIATKNLVAKIDHLCYRREWDLVIYTKNPEHSVLRIIELAQNFPKDLALPPSGGKGCISREEKTAIAEQRNSIPATAWRALLKISGISQATGEIIKIKKWSIMDVYNLEPDILQEIVYPSGIKLGCERAKKIYTALSKRRVWVSVLSEIQGISKAVAELILTAQPIPDDWNVQVLSKIIKPGGKCLGMVVAERMIKTLTFQWQEATPIQ